MKLLLDENLPHDLRHYLAGHDVFTVAYMGWRSLENGDLLLAVLIVKCKSSKIDDLRPLTPGIFSALNHLRPKTLARIG